MITNKVALFIDGENFRHFIESSLVKKGYKKTDYSILDIDINELFRLPLDNFNIIKKIYFSGKIQIVKGTEKNSKILASKQRFLKTKLEKQGYEFIIAGHVRPQTIIKNKKEEIIFKEKGVDVRIAVELIKAAVDKSYNTVILCSSDSDLQPAIKEARNRGLKIVYLGYESMPNKGLTYTTNKTILIRASEVVKTLVKIKQPSP